MVSKAWKGLSEADRAVWKAMAEEDRLRFQRECDAYSGPWKIRVAPDGTEVEEEDSPFSRFVQTRWMCMERANPDANDTEITNMLEDEWSELPPKVRRKFMDKKRARSPSPEPGLPDEESTVEHSTALEEFDLAIEQLPIQPSNPNSPMPLKPTSPLRDDRRPTMDAVTPGRQLGLFHEVNSPPDDIVDRTDSPPLEFPVVTPATGLQLARPSIDLPLTTPALTDLPHPTPTYTELPVATPQYAELHTPSFSEFALSTRSLRLDPVSLVLNDPALLEQFMLRRRQRRRAQALMPPHDPFSDYWR